MSETPESVAPPSNGPAAGPAVDKRAWAESVLREILTLLEFPARLEIKEGPDQGLLVAVHPEGDAPGLQPGKRTAFIDALQFLANKIVNRPNTERRWISLGVGSFPEPRQPPGERPPRAAAPVAAAPRHAPQQVSAPPPQRAPVARLSESDELSVDIPTDEALVSLAKKIAQKSAGHGRYLALVGMKLPERASVLKGAQGVAGVAVKAEGEGRNRRIVFAPDKPMPMPKRLLPQDDIDEDEA